MQIPENERLHTVRVTVSYFRRLIEFNHMNNYMIKNVKYHFSKIK